MDMGPMGTYDFIRHGGVIGAIIRKHAASLSPSGRINHGVLCIEGIFIQGPAPTVPSRRGSAAPTSPSSVTRITCRPEFSPSVSSTL